MNRLEALRIFCLAAETQHFRQAAQTLGISPQAVTRAVYFLEQEFGEMLFIRNTRTTRITPFGEQVYEEARQALYQTDALFQRFSLVERTSEAGLVRVDMPQIDDFGLVDGVLERLHDHPDIVLDWHRGNRYRNTDREQTDVGVRVGTLPNNDFIIKAISPLHQHTVMSPALIERLGRPKSVDDLRQRYPLLGLVNDNNGKVFEWDFGSGSFVPDNPAFLAHQHDTGLKAVLHGRVVGQFSSWALRDYLQQGLLHIVLPEEELTLDWQLYVYRPKRHQQTTRVKRVFDAMVDTLQARFGQT